MIFTPSVSLTPQTIEPLCKLVIHLYVGYIMFSFITWMVIYFVQLYSNKLEIVIECLYILAVMFS